MLERNSFKNDAKCFEFLRYLSFCPDFCGHAGKRLDKKAKVDFKIYDIIDWIANNYNTHTLSQDVKASYEVWSVNEI